MAWCKLGSGECDGCGQCREKPVLEDVFGYPIYLGEHYYDFGKYYVHENNLLKWARDFKKTAGDF